ncbi:MAG: S1 RNA-binding domain-containing protein [Fimbriimonadales bacterium]|nr:S1 RNA-binding domain-containing protein [Fimbriimonadales bacterium]
MWNDEQTRENPTDETTPMTETTPDATTSVANHEPTAETTSASETIVAESDGAVAESEPVETETAVVATAETPAEPVAETTAPAEPAAETVEPVAQPAAPSPAAALSTETQPASPAPADEPMSMDEAIEQSFPSFEPGEVIQATVVQVDRDAALVDVGTKTEIKIPKEELGTGKIDSAEEVVRVGDTIDVKVVRTRGEGGAPVLSKREADFDKLWDSIVEAYNNKETLEAMVEDAVKGGVVVNIGVRCFVPASQIARRLPPNQLDRLVGEVIPIKIIDVDEEKRKVVASNRQAEEELRKQREEEERQRRERVFSTLKVGQRFQGVVKRIASYGAFVDIGDYEGLLHISEMSWARVENPREVLKEGDEIEVVVIRLEPDQGKVALSRRQVMPDPWQLAAQQYKEGDEIEAPITRVARTGAFARVMEGVEAFLPLSELSSKRVKSADEVVQVGETVKGRIIELDPRRRRMVVSLRAPEEQRAVQEHRQRTGGGGKSTGFTIGERLSSQLQQLRTETSDAGAAEATETAEPAAGTETDAPNA